MLFSSLDKLFPANLLASSGLIAELTVVEMWLLVFINNLYLSIFSQVQIFSLVTQVLKMKRFWFLTFSWTFFFFHLDDPETTDAELALSVVKHWRRQKTKQNGLIFLFVCLLEGQRWWSVLGRLLVLRRWTGDWENDPELQRRRLKESAVDIWNLAAVGSTLSPWVHPEDGSAKSCGR